MSQAKSSGRGSSLRLAAATLAVLAPAAAALAKVYDGTPVEDVTATEWVVILDRAHPDALRQLGNIAAARPTGVVANSYVLKFGNSVNATAAAAALGRAKGLSIGSLSPLVARQRHKRFIPNDPQFASQWHLRNTGQNGGTVGVDTKVTGVWDSYRGGGVTIGIVDDGLQHTHPDLQPNYSAALSWDFNKNDNNPTPDDPDWDMHGTSVAGVAAGRGNNGLGISGAAPEATLAGIRLIAGSVTDLTEATALRHQPNAIDIYSNSWGPADFGDQDGPGPLTRAALADGARTGRGGRGSIYVWAGGNGLDFGDNVNYDGYANSRFTIAVAAIDDCGRQANYSERGAPLLVAAHSSSEFRQGITTTDNVGMGGYNWTAGSAIDDDPNSDLNYTSTFGGTSSATPLVSGVIALMLDANPNLSARDVQHILVRTAARNDATDAGWATNGGGLHVNHKYGFGAVDAAAAVAAAEHWRGVGDEVSIVSPTKSVNRAIADNNAIGVTDSITITQDIVIEWVEVQFNATHTFRGDLAIELTSPDGTKSVLSEAHGDAGDNYNWLFTSARHWDETSAGTWTLKVADLDPGATGTWQSWSLNFHGTAIPEPAAAGACAAFAAATLLRRRQRRAAA
jgi:subtilisin-like proprotein convertase family protein